MLVTMHCLFICDQGDRQTHSDYDGHSEILECVLYRTDSECGIMVHRDARSMIDVHNHLLSGFDDGSREWAETLAMCRIAVQDGIKIIVATPHSLNGDYISDPLQVTDAVDRLNRDLEIRKLPLKILPGMEVRIVPELIELATQGKILTLGRGRFLLVEFHPAHVPSGFHNLVEQARDAGYGIVLGHPEKNFGVLHDPDFLTQLLRRFTEWELLIQISADSVTGEAGSLYRKMARHLLKHGMVHIIASDAHSSRFRLPKLSAAVDITAKLVGTEKARQLVWDIPRAVLRGLGFPQYESPREPGRWWQSLWPFRNKGG